MSQSAQIRALDLLYHFSARPGARVAIGSPAVCPEAPADVLADMDAAGIERIFVSQCKKWSCERQWACADTRLEDVLRYVSASPRFVGLAGYNPYDIAESLREIEFAISRHGFRGIYLHPENYRLPLTGERMYPLFAKAAELGVPALVEFTAEMPLDGMTAALSRIADDLPELALAVAHPRPKPATLSQLAGCENIFFVLDSGVVEWMVARKEDREFLASDVFCTRAMWGSNGQNWTYARAGWERLEISPAAATGWLRDNAARVFRLAQPAALRTPSSVVDDPMNAER